MIANWSSFDRADQTPSGGTGEIKYASPASNAVQILMFNTSGELSSIYRFNQTRAVKFSYNLELYKCLLYKLVERIANRVKNATSKIDKLTNWNLSLSDIDFTSINEASFRRSTKNLQFASRYQKIILSSRHGNSHKVPSDNKFIETFAIVWKQKLALLVAEWISSSWIKFGILLEIFSFPPIHRVAW